MLKQIKGANSGERAWRYSGKPVMLIYTRKSSVDTFLTYISHSWKRALPTWYQALLAELAWPQGRQEADKSPVRTWCLIPKPELPCTLPHSHAEDPELRHRFASATFSTTGLQSLHGRTRGCNRLPVMGGGW